MFEGSFREWQIEGKSEGADMTTPFSPRLDGGAK